MTDSKDEVECSVHGKTVAAFVCTHLAHADATDLGVAYDDESAEPWPDMVCDACDADDIWSSPDASKDIRVVCGNCWDTAFGKNTPVRHPNAEEWLHDAFHRAERRHQRWADEFKIGDAHYFRYDLAPMPPWLGFGPSEGRFTVLCEPVVVGSWSDKSKTWLWGWANSWWQPEVTSPVVRVKRAGECLGIDRLWRGFFEAEEDPGWELATAALDLMPDFNGLYRCPSEDGALFLAVKNTRWTE